MRIFFSIVDDGPSPTAIVCMDALFYRDGGCGPFDSVAVFAGDGGPMLGPPAAMKNQAAHAWMLRDVPVYDRVQAERWRTATLDLIDRTLGGGRGARRAGGPHVVTG